MKCQRQTLWRRSAPFPAGLVFCLTWVSLRQRRGAYNANPPESFIVKGSPSRTVRVPVGEPEST